MAWPVEHIVAYQDEDGLWRATTRWSPDAEAIRDRSTKHYEELDIDGSQEQILHLQASLAQAVRVLHAQYELTMRVIALADSVSDFAFVRSDDKAEVIAIADEVRRVRGLRDAFLSEFVEKETP